MELRGVSSIRKQLVGSAWGMSVNDRVSTKTVKAELLHMAEEQERAWMNMKYTVDELERRLRIIEIEKAQFEDILQLRMITSTLGAAPEDSDGSSDLQDSLVDYNSFYVSKIFEDMQIGSDCAKPSGKRLRRQLTSLSEVGGAQEDPTWQMEAQRLRREVSRLEEELRLATHQQVTVDVLYDAHEEISDVASSSPVSEAATTLEGLPRGDFDDGGTATFSGQLSESFLRHTSILEGLHHSFKKRWGNSDLLGVLDSVIDLLTELSRELARACTTLQTDLQSGGHMPPWVSSLENALASLKEDVTFTGETSSQLTDISELERKLKAESCQLTDVLDKHAAELRRKDDTIKYAQDLNMQLATDLTRLESELADVRSQNKGLQASIEVPSKEARCRSTLIQSEQAKSEAKLLGLERLLAGKDSQLQEVRRRLHAVQSETDATAIEKIDLLQKLRDLRKEADSHKERVKELVAINKEALQFAESKEKEATRLQLTLTGSERTLQGMTESYFRLTEELKEANMQVAVVDAAKETERMEHNAVKGRVKEMQYEMRQREAALERLTKYLATLVRDSDAFHSSSSLRFQHGARNNSSREKDNKALEQYRQSKVVIRDLEEKVGSMERLESEFSKVRVQMAEMKLDGSLVPQKST